MSEDEKVRLNQVVQVRGLHHLPYIFVADFEPAALLLQGCFDYSVFTRQSCSTLHPERGGEDGPMGMYSPLLNDISLSCTDISDMIAV